MTYLIRTDEAGYGPNLGPLVISATVWQVPAGLHAGDCARVQGSGVGVQGSGGTAGGGSGAGAMKPVLIADSKSLYRSGKGLALLERGVLAALGVLGSRPATWRGVWEALAPDAAGPMDSIPWFAGHDEPVPLEADSAERDLAAEALGGELAEAGVRLVAVRSRAVFEGQFNDLVERNGSKGAALSRETLDLVAETIARLDGGAIHVLCDKHGGRNAYRPLLEEAFPDRLIEVCGEGRERSLYRFGPAERRVEIRFQAKAEAHLPAALASMASKYLRELAMRAYNRFWCGRVPGLAPTAGYPLDAKRFKAAIASAQAQLAIPDRLVWRVK